MHVFTSCSIHKRKEAETRYYYNPSIKCNMYYGKKKKSPAQSNFSCPKHHLPPLSIHSNHNLVQWLPSHNDLSRPRHISLRPSKISPHHKPSGIRRWLVPPMLCGQLHMPRHITPNREPMSYLMSGAIRKGTTSAGCKAQPAKSIQTR